MDNKENKLREQLLLTHSEFIKLIKEEKYTLVLRVDEDTKNAISSMDLKIPFSLICDIPGYDPKDQFRKRKLIQYKWIWTIPEFKRSHSGRIYND